MERTRFRMYREDLGCVEKILDVERRFRKWREDFERGEKF